MLSERLLVIQDKILGKRSIKYVKCDFVNVY